MQLNYITISIIAAIIGFAFILAIIYYAKRKNSSVLASIITGIATIITAIIATIGTGKIGITKDINNLDLSKRIEIVSEDMKNTANELASIQSELQQRIELVDKLNNDAKNAEAIIDMSKDQVDAVSAILNSELNKSNNQNFWVSFAMNVFFMILGSIVTIFTPKLIKLIKRDKVQP